MISEKTEVKKYFSGNVDKKNLYRAVYMMAKYHKSNGLPMKDALATILEWVKLNKLTLNFSPMGCIHAAYQNQRELNEGMKVSISEKDKDTILRFAYSESEKLLALALVCYAKAFANKHGVFKMSFSALAQWLDMDRSNLYRRYLKPLISFGFIAQHETPEALKAWNRDGGYGSEYELLVPYDKGGEYELVDNDIHDLYKRVFAEDNTDVTVA